MLLDFDNSQTKNFSTLSKGPVSQSHIRSLRHFRGKKELTYLIQTRKMLFERCFHKWWIIFRIRVKRTFQRITNNTTSDNEMFIALL